MMMVVVADSSERSELCPGGGRCCSPETPRLRPSLSLWWSSTAAAAAAAQARGGGGDNGGDYFVDSSVHFAGDYRRRFQSYLNYRLLKFLVVVMVMVGVTAAAVVTAVASLPEADVDVGQCRLIKRQNRRSRGSPPL